MSIQSLLPNNSKTAFPIPTQKNTKNLPSQSILPRMRLFSGRLPENRSLFSGSLPGNKSLVSGSCEKSTCVNQAKGGAEAMQQEFVSIALSKAWAQPVQWSCICWYSTSELLGSSGRIVEISEPDNKCWYVGIYMYIHVKHLFHLLMVTSYHCWSSGTWKFMNMGKGG